MSYITSGSTGTDWVSGGTRTVSIDSGSSGSNRCLWVLVRADRSSTTTIDGATYNGVAMTAVTDEFDGADSIGRRLFRLVAPAMGANNLVISASSDSIQVGAIFLVHSDVNQTTPESSATTAGPSVSSGNSHTFSQTTTSGHTCVVMAHSNDAGGAGQYAPYGSATERFDNYAFISDLVASGSSETMGFTVTPTMQLARVGFSITPAGGGTTKTVSITLVTSPTDSTARANLTGLKWAFFDQTTPDNFAAPTDKGTGETTNGSGVLDITLTNSTKTNGQTGFLIVTDSDGTTTQSPSAKAFAGPVTVTVS